MSEWRALQGQLSGAGYVASDDLAMALHLALVLGRPLLLEGAAGVGKTEVARTLAAIRDTRLIRLQCYEGLDAGHAIYEWNYQRQLLAIRAAAESDETGADVEARIFSERFLLARPLLEAITAEGGDAFQEYQVPLAILAMLQGLGRLIRHRSDRGVLAVLDPRLRTMGYGRRFLDSFPPAPVTQNPEAVSRFFAE